MTAAPKFATGQPKECARTDSAGRRLVQYMCCVGHLHRGRVQAVRCNAKQRAYFDALARVQQ